MTTLPTVSVSQLNKQIRFYLENDIGIVHVEGEVSNLSKPGSGHCYFTLKDALAQIRCVFFKNRHTPQSTLALKDGQQLLANGRLSLYEARGDYQLIVESISEAGTGLLYQRFEALKKKLAEEGLFDAARKKSLPLFPEAIAIITSGTGAALRDILSTLARRYPLARVFVYPCEVQGVNAPSQLLQALKKARQDGLAEVIILARGGGSMEDLWAFNDELLAREIADCPIPLVSGVGHETDFTIADFAADYRAETPTAAAEAVTPDWMELLSGFENFAARLTIAMMKHLEHTRLRLNHLQDKIASPKSIIATQSQTLDYLESRLASAIQTLVCQKRQLFHQYQFYLQAQNPKIRIRDAKIQLQQIQPRLRQSMQHLLSRFNGEFRNRLSTLHAVSPLATLERGYAIASKQEKVLYSSDQAAVGDQINIRLSRGQLDCKVIARD